MYDCREGRGSPVLVGCLVFVAFFAGRSSVVSGQTVRAHMKEIFGGTDWYTARSEPEQEWLGVLQKRHVVAGPGSRTATSLELVVSDRQRLPVYAPNVGRQLETYLGHSVIVRGKLVDLSDEGYGKELWIGSIRGDNP
jgi:hypothetical protein